MSSIASITLVVAGGALLRARRGAASGSPASEWRRRGAPSAWLVEEIRPCARPLLIAECATRESVMRIAAEWTRGRGIEPSAELGDPEKDR